MSQQIVIDSLAFARDGGVKEGELPVTRLSRLHDYLAEISGSLSYRLIGQVSTRGRRQLQLHVEGTLLVRCQRCLDALAYPLVVDSLLELIRDENDLSQDEIEDDTRDFIPAQKELDVAALIEDEVILALPVAPRHPEECTLPAADKVSAKDSPFAALAALKGKGS
jgi:uncharacterized protein